MRLGISSFTYGWAVGVGGYSSGSIDENDLLQRAVAFGLDTVQIGDNLPLHEFSNDRLIAFKASAFEKSIHLEVGARELSQKNLETYLEIASRLDARLIRFVTDGEEFAPELQEITSVLKNALSRLKAAGIKLGIENHDRLKAAEIASVMEAVGDPHIGVCLDCVNSMGAGEGLEHVLNVLAPYTINLHIKDFVIKRVEHKMGFLITGERTGKGMIDVPHLLEKLHTYGRCESAVLEQWVPPENNTDDTISKEKAWAVEGVAYLKGLLPFSKYKNK